jgi:hypothetical protein
LANESANTTDPTKEFLERLARPLLAELASVNSLKEFTTNSDVIGAHAEAVVRRLVARTVHPLRVSTGTVIDVGIPPGDTLQFDTIVWFPLPVAAVFEIDNFGVVTRGSTMALLEIKRSVYTVVGKRLAKALDPATVAKHVAG